MDWWIVATGVEPRIPPITSLDHPNFLSYVDVLRRDTNVGDRVAIIGAVGIRFNAKMWMEDWVADGTNEARAGDDAAPSQRRRGRRKKRQKGGGRGRSIVLMHRQVGNMGNLGRTAGWIHRAAFVKSGRVLNLGGVTYKKVYGQGRLHITVHKKGKEKKGGERESLILEVDNMVIDGRIR